MLKRPPQHQIDATGVWFSIEDDGLDIPRIEREKAELIKAGRPPGEHPIDRYLAGATRYDLDAPLELPAADDAETKPVNVRDYITGSLTLFTLKRLGRREYRRVLSLARINPLDAAHEAARGGVSAISGLGDPLRAGVGGLTDEQLDMLHNIDTNLIDDLGNAVIRFSRELTHPESKPSG